MNATILSNAIPQRLTIIAILCLGSGVAVLGGVSPDELKQRILAQTQSIGPDDYAFTRTIRSDGVSNGKSEKKVMVEKFDPTKPAEARWTLVSVDGAAPSVDDLDRFRKDAPKRRMPGYYRLAGYFGSAATASTDSRGRTVFHFAALPKDTVKVMDSDVTQNATAEATLGEADGVQFVEQIHVSVRPMRIKLIAKLNSYEYTARFRMGPEGKPLLMEQNSEMSGSGMGQEGHGHTVVTYSDYRAITSHR
jgi:hypothetical protein